MPASPIRVRSSDHAATGSAVVVAFNAGNLEPVAKVMREAHPDLDLVICVAAAQRRGIVDDGEAERNGKDATNIADGFRISGLGQLIEGAVQSDRLVVFGD